MSGGLLANELTRQLDIALSDEQRTQLINAHAASFSRRVDEVRPLPGAVDLLHALSELNAAWAIATSGSPADANPGLTMLGISADASLVTSQPGEPAKPDPALFLRAPSQLTPSPTTFVIGDSVWDMLAARRAGFLGVGVFTGGSSASELIEAGAYRIFDDAEHLRLGLDLLGLHSSLTAPRTPR
jgi:HAD superfamily hydrolase (TIGR01549 family)